MRWLEKFEPRFPRKVRMTTLARKMDLLRHPNVAISLTAFVSPSDLPVAQAHIIVSGLFTDPFTASRFLASAASTDLPYATALFTTLPHPTLFMYNTIIMALSNSPHPLHSLPFYTQMLRNSLFPNHHTLPSLIRACSATHNATIFGLGLHSHALRLALDADVFVLNNLISMYSGWREMDSAHRLFEEKQAMTDVVSWTTLITGYSVSGKINHARRLFDWMPTRNVVSWNAMIAGYAQRGMGTEAWQLFSQIPEKNGASWSLMVSGFAQSGLCKEALSVFRDMLRAGVAPKEPTLVSAVSACAQLRSLEEGEWVHGYVEFCQLEINAVLGTALVDMYGKCGSIDKAVRVFNRIAMKNAYSWNVMITSLAMNGCEKPALTLFWKMQLMGVEPNSKTFIGLLGACSHAGLVNEGWRFFHTMGEVYGIRPMQQHYGCMVDLLGKAGLLIEAAEFVERMPVEPHSGLWGALAGACRIHGVLELGEEVAKHWIELEPQNIGRYLLLANIYGAARRWDDMALVKKLLREKYMTRGPGRSIVEVLPDIKQLPMDNY